MKTKTVLLIVFYVLCLLAGMYLGLLLSACAMPSDDEPAEKPPPHPLPICGTPEISGNGPGEITPAPEAEQGGEAEKSAPATESETPAAGSAAEDNQTAPESGELPEEVRIMILKPLPIYPAYYFDCNGVLWGIPRDLQGELQKVKIDVVELSDGEEKPVVVESFCIAEGMIALQVEIGANNVGVMQYAYFGQAVGSTEIGEIASNSFEMPPSVRQVVNLPEFNICTTVYKGEEYSDIYNCSAAMKQYTANPKGYGPVRVQMVDAFAVLDNGLLFTTGTQLAFWPSNRTAVNFVAELGRLWK